VTDKTKKLILFSTIILIGIFFTLYNYYLTTIDQVYTVGQITKIWKPASGGFEAGYQYSLDGVSYTNSVSIYKYESIAIPDKCFIVKIPLGHPSSGIMLLDKPIADTVKAPESGWTEIPNFLK
jgi:hypothetical protein